MNKVHCLHVWNTQWIFFNFVLEKGNGQSFCSQKFFSTLSCTKDSFAGEFWYFIGSMLTIFPSSQIHTLILQSCPVSGQRWNGIGFYQTPESCLGREVSTGALIYPQDRKSPEEGAAVDTHELVGSQFSLGETKEKLREDVYTPYLVWKNGKSYLEPKQDEERRGH